MSSFTINLDDRLATRLAEMAASQSKPLPEWAAEQLTRLASSSIGVRADGYTAEWQAAFGSISDLTFRTPARSSTQRVEALDAE